MKKTLLILLGLLIALPSFARDFEYTYEGQTLTYTVLDEADKTCSVGSNSGVTGDLKIPEKVSDGSTEFTVTTIGKYAFSDCSGLTSVTIPESVTTIEYGAFSGCSGLTSVTIPNSVTTIGDQAFRYCYYLISVTIGNSVANIGSYAFCECNRLTSITIPKSVTAIGDYAFSGHGLTSIEVDSGNTRFSSSNGVLFNKDQTELLQIPAGKSGAYEIPNSVTTISSYTFSSCTRLTSIEVEAGNTMFSSSNGVLFNKDQTVLLRFPGVKGGAYEIPESVTTIGSSAFRGCSGLTSVTIPNSVTTIGYGAFMYCSPLKSIKLMGTIPPEVNGDVCYNYAIATLEIPQGSFEKYAGTIWNKFQNIKVGGVMAKAFNDGVFNYRLSPDAESPIAVLMPGDYSEMEEASIPERFTDDSDPDNPVRYTITAIGPDAFKDCRNLKIVNFNSRTKIKAIASHAFYKCSGLTEVSIPETVTTIGDYAFYGCDGLTKAEFASIESLCNIDFGDCYANPLSRAYHLYINGEEVTSVEIPKTVTKLKGTFAGFSALKTIDIPESVTTIGDDAFYDCGLTSVTIPNSVTTIGEYAFRYSALTSVSIGNSVTTIGHGAFENCGLTSVTIPNSVTSIGETAFWNCSITSVTIGNSVTSIGKDAFRYCYYLTSVTLGNSLSEINSHVFDGCPINKLNITDGYGSLHFVGGDVSWMSRIKELYLGRNVEGVKFPSVTRVEIGNQVEEIGESMFSGCTGLTEVALGNGLTTIGNNAFSGCSLTEVIVPPSVETIEASAFADNSNLATVTMGHKVASIGDMAYNGCPVDEVYITALTPPAAPNNTFSRYSGRLWVPNAQAVEDYYNAYTCWDRFDTYAMIEPEEIKIEGVQTIDAAPGDTIRLTATISPDNVTLPQIFWRSTNPDIATVDNNGVVVVRGVEPEISTYAQGDDYTSGGCCIIAESLYADAPIAMVAINSELADLEGIIIDRRESQTIDYAEPYDVYNMQGVWLGRSADAVAPGFYILRQGSKAAKILK